MLPVQEAIFKILGQAETECPGMDQTALRNVLESVLYQYEVKQQCTQIVPINDFRDKIAYYLSSKRVDGLSELTINMYKSHLLKFASHVSKDLDKLTAMDIKYYLGCLQKSNNLKQTTMQTEVSILKSFFKWLVDNDVILKSPMGQIKQPKAEKRLRKPLTPDEVEQMRLGCKTARQTAIFEFALATGCRVSELVGMNQSHLEKSSKSLKVIGKGNKERVVLYNARASMALRVYLGQRGDDGIDALFINSKSPHNRLGKRSIEKEIEDIAKNAGMDRNIYPHLLRHTFATLNLASGMSLVSIQHLLGHSDPSTTQVYAKMDMNTVREEYRRCMAQ
jgi:integrase/recombinase XerD